MEQLKETLLQKGYTCLVKQGRQLFPSTKRGVAPLLVLLDTYQSLPGAIAADKVVGRATAYLYVLLQVEAVYGLTVSLPALEVLKAYGITCRYDRLVSAIRNRTDTGPCPMEAATAACTTPQQALAAILETLKTLS